MASDLERSAGYKLSRSALREKYGSRAITNKGQSPLDSTPSGREARAMQGGASKEEAVQFADQQFRESFSPRQQIQPPPVISRAGMQAARPQVAQNNYQGLASPDDVRGMVQSGAVGQVKTPWGSITLPNTIPATDMAQYVPATVSPLTNFGLPKPAPYLSTAMQGASRWRSI